MKEAERGANDSSEDLGRQRGWKPDTLQRLWFFKGVRRLSSVEQEGRRRRGEKRRKVLTGVSHLMSSQLRVRVEVSHGNSKRNSHCLPRQHPECL